MDPLSVEQQILETTLGLLPPGDALPRARSSEIAKLLRVTARTLSRLEGLADEIAVDFDPRSTTTFLEDWERVLGLPECSDVAAGTTAERREQVLEKYTRRSNLTASELADACDALGFPVTIDENPTGTTAHTFNVQVTGGLQVNYFRVGESSVGEPLGSFGDERLRCLIDKRKPAFLNYGLTV